MRISDWSADVCSSDLRVGAIEFEQPDGSESWRDVNVGRLAGESGPRDAVLNDAEGRDHYAEHGGVSRLAPEEAPGERADGPPLDLVLVLVQLFQQVEAGHRRHGRTAAAPLAEKFGLEIPRPEHLPADTQL